MIAARGSPHLNQIDEIQFLSKTARRWEKSGSFCAVN